MQVVDDFDFVWSVVNFQLSVSFLAFTFSNFKFSLKMFFKISNSKIKIEKSF